MIDERHEGIFDMCVCVKMSVVSLHRKETLFSTLRVGEEAFNPFRNA